MIRKLLRFTVKVILWFFGITIFWVLLHKWVPVPITPLMVIRGVEKKSEGKDIIYKHNWVNLNKMSIQIQVAVICNEDQNFLSHNGFDYEAIEKAYNNNKLGKKIKGGSTISQQTAKNVFLWPQRSYLRKGLEAYFTFLIELFWSKERIMEVYLNSIEMGNGIYGVEAASQYWFKKSASKLTIDQAAALAAILPNPRKYRATPASNFIQKRKNWTLKQMQFYGPLNYTKSDVRK